MESNTTLPVNIGNPEEYSILEFAKIVKNLIGNFLDYKWGRTNPVNRLRYRGF